MDRIRNLLNADKATWSLERIQRHRCRNTAKLCSAQIEIAESLQAEQDFELMIQVTRRDTEKWHNIKPSWGL